MEKNIPSYRMFINEEDVVTGVDFISLVNQPATEENWMAFSSVKFDFEVQKDKRMLFGALMVPEKRIYRNDDIRGEYHVFFEKEDIEAIVRKFSKNNFNNNLSFEHLGIKVKGTLVENFIIREGMSIKGFEELPVGTWMGCVYIEDEVFWTNFVKTDVVKGFSVEINALLQRQDFSNSNIIWDELMEILNKNILLSDMKMEVGLLLKKF